MTCPGCHRILPAPVDRCPHCAYDAWTCVDHFPYSPPPLDRYIDVENRLSNDERARIDRAIETLENNLPQIRVHVCIVKLLPGTDARECGFWMLNASIPRDEEEALHRPWSVLLLIDTHASAASATVGYGLDPFVSDSQLRAALTVAQPEWQEANFSAGILKFVHQMHHALKQAHRSAVSAARKDRRQPPPSSSRPSPSTAPPPARHPES
jgi:uncharacterized membrane protein YgcG